MNRPMRTALLLGLAAAALFLETPGSRRASEAPPRPVPAPAPRPSPERYVPPMRTAPGPVPPREPVRATGDGLAFTGVAYTSFIPADPDIAVGTGHVVLVVNGAIAVYTREGAFVWQVDLDIGGGFFDAVGRTGLVFDPQVVYDPATDRFLVVVAERLEGVSSYLFAISAGGDPSGEWHAYRIPVTGVIEGNIDSPNVGVGPDAFYLAADFILPDRYLVTAVDKPSVLGGGAPVVAHRVYTGTHSFGLASHATAGAPRMYMIESFVDEPASTLRLWAVDDPFGAFTLESVLLEVPAYLEPVDIPSLDTPTPIRAFDARLWSSTYVTGSIWACHHVTATPASRVNEVRWYEIAIDGWPLPGAEPTVAQVGRVALPQETFLSFPAIAADPAGNAMLVAARASATEHFSIVRSFRLAEDPPGTMRGPLTVRTSDRGYGLGRWGDYFGMAWDPTRTGVFWAHGKYVPTVNRWATWVTSHDLEIPVGVPGETSPPPARPLAVRPVPSSGPVTLTLPGGPRPLTLEIYDVGGRRLRRLELGAGAQSIVWDGRDEEGAPVAAGVYLVNATSGPRAIARGRITIVR